MDDAQKRIKKNEYQRKWRANKNPTQPIPCIISKPELVVDTDTIPLKYKPKKAKKITLKDSSVSAYTSKLRAFHLRMTGLPLSQDIINAIKGDDYDKKAVQNEFKYLYDKTTFIINNELNAIPNICKIFTKIPGFTKLIKAIVPVKRNIENAQTIRRNNTIINKDDLISFDKQDILKNISKLSNNTDGFISKLNKKLELEKIQQTTINCMWLLELDNLIKLYNEYKEDRDRTMNGEEIKIKKKLFKKVPKSQLQIV
jgi:hypothetical protein